MSDKNKQETDAQGENTPQAEDKAKTNLAAQKQSEVAPTEIDLAGDAGEGLGHMDSDDLLVPRFKILQTLSPECDKSKENEYVEGVEVGEIFNTATRKSVKELHFVVVAHRKTYLEWAADRGGFVADHGPDSTILDSTTKGEKNQNLTEDGNEISLTHEYLVMTPDDGGLGFISMSKSQIKYAKALNTALSGLLIPNPNDPSQKINPPIFYNAFKATTAVEQKGSDTWFSWKIEPMFDNDKGVIGNLEDGKGIYLAAKNMRKLHDEGRMKVDPPTADDNKTGTDDDIPF